MSSLKQRFLSGLLTFVMVFTMIGILKLILTSVLITTYPLIMFGASNRALQSVPLERECEKKSVKLIPSMIE